MSFQSNFKLKSSFGPLLAYFEKRNNEKCVISSKTIHELEDVAAGSIGEY